MACKSLHPGIHCRAHHEGAVVELVIDHGKGNILDTATCHSLATAMREHMHAAGLKLLVLRGAGGHFSFGASVQDHKRDHVAAMLTAFHGVCRLIARSQVPVLAAVEGQCLGGAFELVLCCHLVLVKQGAKLGCPEIKLGVFPPVLAAVGHLRLGAARTERLILTGEPMAAEEAVACGLAAQLVAAEQDLGEAVAHWYAAHLGGLSAFALRQAVQAARHGSGMAAAVGEGIDRAERQYLSSVIGSHDGNEGIAAFLERRDPIWTHA